VAVWKSGEIYADIFFEGHHSGKFEETLAKFRNSGEAERKRL